MSRANLLTALVAASTCLALYCALGRLAGVHTSLAMYAFDLVVLFGAALVFLLFQRRRWLAGLVFTSAYALLAWAAMEKYRLLGLWVRAGDVALVDEAWQVSSPSERTLVALFAASIVAGA
ncbi:MAG: hypothetical protein R3190_12705, partial [Thermoanaerobaculia bacterium]|nr:hypothetical protein [Thermoanaerobaculia bacterium]